MLLLTTIFILFSIILMYKNIKNHSTQFLIGIILSWSLSLISLIIYLNSLNYYHNIANQLFNIPANLWKLLLFFDINIDSSIRLLNIGVLSFTYFLLCFAISFSHYKLFLSHRTLFILLIIIPMIQVIYYDIAFTKAIFPYILNAFGDQIVLYYRFQIVAQHFFKVINMSYIFFAFLLLVSYYIKYPKIRFIKYYTLFTTLCLIPIAIVYILMFSWLPKHLVRPTLVPNYYNYVVPDLNSSILMFNIIPFIVFIAFISLLFSIFKYSAIENYHRSQDVHINRSFNIASLGMQAMTHSIKNHLLAIKSETEYLTENYKDNDDIKNSLALITQSYNGSLSVINKAANQLKTIILDLNPKAIDVPLLDIIERLDTNRRGKITYDCCTPTPYVFMDKLYLSEAFYNIIDNAFDAIAEEENGQISILIEIMDHFVSVSISDNGCGMADDSLASLFLPFNSTKNSLNNWGIGLAYCHKIITAHDGIIQVESKINNGTTIKVLLPHLDLEKEIKHGTY